MDVKSKFVTIVLLSALGVAFESVAVEGALNIEDLDLILVSAMPSIAGGMILLSLRPAGSARFVRGLGRRGWSWMIVLCLLVALGVLLWFDAVSRIGAGKEALLGGGSSEVLFVVILSAIFLSERLSKLEAVGGVMIIVGVFIVLTNTEDMTLSIGPGEIEAVVSSFLLGCSVVLTTAMLKEYDLTPLSGLELLLSGALILVLGGPMLGIAWPAVGGWLLLVTLGLFPAVCLLAYNAGLPKIGASLTSVLYALNGIMTLGVQLLILALFPDAELIRPESILLAVGGGIVAFAGVYLINRKPAPGTAMSRSANRSAEGEI